MELSPSPRTEYGVCHGPPKGNPLPKSGFMEAHFLRKRCFLKSCSCSAEELSSSEGCLLTNELGFCEVCHLTAELGFFEECPLTTELGICKGCPLTAKLGSSEGYPLTAELGFYEVCVSNEGDSAKVRVRFELEPLE